MYYLLKTQKLLDENNKSNIEEISLIEPSNLFDKDNHGLLFNIWMYVTLFDEYNLPVSKENKKEIINLLGLLQNDDGLFNSFYLEGKYEEMYNYVFPTKLALDIYQILNTEAPNKNKIQSWIDENVDTLMSMRKNDFISNGGLLYLLKYIKNMDDTNVDNSLDQYIDSLSSLYQNAPNSAEKFDTALNINTTFSHNIFNIDNKEMVDYLEDIQIDNGAFTLYGNKKNADAMTTYISVRLLSHFQVNISKKAQLITWMNDEINSIFDIKKN